MIAAFCVASPLAIGVCAGIAIHAAVLAYPWDDAAVGSPAPVTVARVTGKNGQPLTVRIQTTNNPAELPADFLSNSLPPGSTPAGVAGRGIVSPPAGQAMTDALRGALVQKQATDGDAVQKLLYIEGPAVTDAQLVYLFREHIACQGATKPGKAANSCQAGGYGNDNCYCNWRNSVDTEPTYNPAAYAAGMAAWRAAGSPNLSGVSGRLSNGRLYWGPSEADGSTMYAATHKTCAAGQTLDYAAGTCTNSGISNGQCDWFIDGDLWRSNPFDPDCVNAEDRVQPRADGGVDIDGGAGAAASVTKKPDGQIRIEEKYPAPGGNTERRGVDINPGPGPGGNPPAPVPGSSGVVGKDRGISDGQSSGPATPHGSGTSPGTGGSCGGPGQSVCKTELTGKGSADLGAIDGDVGAPAAVRGKLDGYSSTTFVVSTQCPTDAFSFSIPLPESMGGPVSIHELTPGGVNFCTLINPWEGVIRAVELSMAVVMAAFIVLRA